MQYRLCIMGSKRFCSCKVHIFWEGHKILRNLHQLFDWKCIRQIIGGYFAKCCGLLRIYELFLSFLPSQEKFSYFKCFTMGEIRLKFIYSIRPQNFAKSLRFDHYYIGQIYGGDFAKNLWPSQNIWTLLKCDFNNPLAPLYDANLQLNIYLSK